MKLFLSICLSTLILFNTSALAAGCGSGTITHVKEGGWNSNDLMIKIDYSITPSNHDNTLFNGWIRFRNTLNGERFKAIRSLAYLAFSSGQSVAVFSHATSAQCANATELTIF